MRNNSNRAIKRLMILFAGIIGIFGLTSCTKSFTTNQDKATQLYATYGDLYATSVDLTGDDDYNKNYNVTVQNTNREALFSTLTEANGYASLDKDFLTFMDKKVDTFVSKKSVLWTDGTLAKENEATAGRIATAVAIYAGLDENGKVAPLFTNFDTWYDEAVQDSSVGILKAPSNGLVSALKSSLTKKSDSIRAGFSPESIEFHHNGSDVYIEGKTWGQAFSEYGFLEGLFVYPFAWIVHKISSIDMANGWMQILAIAIITLLARIITVIQTVVQTRSQAKQQRIQPLLNQLQKKYPDQNDPEQRRALALEQSQLMRQNKVHPLLPMLFLIIQFPLFICVWSALQDSAALAAGNWLGLSLTTAVSTCFTAYATTPGALVGIFVFIVMTVANILASATSLFFNSWRTKNFGTTTVQTGPDGQPVDPNKTMKWMTIIMSVFVIFMGWNLPAGMGIYWLFGSLISIIQTLIMEMVQTHHRHAFAANTGDGTTLAAIRRSKHHTTDGKKADKKASKSDKPMWR